MYYVKSSTASCLKIVRGNSDPLHYWGQTLGMRGPSCWKPQHVSWGRDQSHCPSLKECGGHRILKCTCLQGLISSVEQPSIYERTKLYVEFLKLLSYQINHFCWKIQCFGHLPKLVGKKNINSSWYMWITYVGSNFKGQWKFGGKF